MFVNIFSIWIARACCRNILVQLDLVCAAERRLSMLLCTSYVIAVVVAACICTLTQRYTTAIVEYANSSLAAVAVVCYDTAQQHTSGSTTSSSISTHTITFT
jgi:hypothetical protein